MYLNSAPLRYGWVLLSLTWLSIFISKSLYIVQSQLVITLIQYMNELSSEIFLLSFCLTTYLFIHRRCYPWLALLLKTFLTSASLLILIGSFSVFYVFFVTGQLPRLQQLQGLNWDLMSASITPMLYGIKYHIIGTLLILIALFWLLEKYLKQIADRYYYRFFTLSMIVAIVSLGLNNCLTTHQVCQPNQQLLALQLFDYDIVKMDDKEAETIERRFFDNYQKKLAMTTGLHPDYQEIYPLLKGKNIILLVLESVRHKELPIHGGQANMPYLQSLADKSQLIIFDHMYSQDIRSTKAYAALDMGMFALLSWDSYSNHLTQHFTDKSLPYQLKKDNYQSYSYTSGSASYDQHKTFQIYRGYDETVYVDWDDDKLLKRMQQRFANIDSPFYMQVWPMATHHPYTRDFWKNRKQWLKQHPEGIKHGQPEDYQRYLQSLNDTDDFLKQMIEQLKANGLYQNTVIIGVGDHGEAFGKHHKGNVFHGSNIYEESIHVAAFIHSPQLRQTQHESRFFSHKDLIASIKHLSSDNEQIIFNDARSIFNQYFHEMPIYSYNSWSKYLSIIWQGQKLRYKDEPNPVLYFNSISNIETDLNQESREVQKNDDYLEHQQLLKQWQQALQALTYRRLYPHKNTDTDNQFNDFLSIYCDDGQGFRESNQNRSRLTKRLNNNVIILLNKHCQAIRLAFLHNYNDFDNKEMRVQLKDFKIQTATQILTLQEINISQLVATEILKTAHFKIIGKSAFVDFKLADKPISLQKISFNIDLLESIKH